MSNEVRFQVKIEDGASAGLKTISVNADDLRKGIAGVKGEVDRLNSGFVNFAQFSQGMDSLAAMARQVEGALSGLTAAYAQQAVAETQLETVMRQRMAATDEDIAGIKALASEQQKLGVIGDEVQLAGAQQVATFLDEKESIETLLPAMNDLLAQQKGLNATQQDAVGIGNMLGKVMQGQTSALSRVGISFTEAQEAALKYGTEAERASVLAEVIRDNVGEMNAQLAGTDAGRMQQVSNRLGDVREQIGSLAQGAMPFVTIAAQCTQAAAGTGKLIVATRTLIPLNVRERVVGLAGAAATGVQSQARAILTTVTGGATVSTTALTAATVALTAAYTLGLSLAIAGAVAAYNKLTTASDAQVEADKRAKEAADRVKEARAAETAAGTAARAEMVRALATLKEFKGSKDEEARLVRDMNTAYGESMGQYRSVADWYQVLQAKSELYCKQMVNEVRMRNLANEAAKAQEEMESVNLDDASKTRKTRTTREYLGTATAGIAIWGKATTEEIVGSSEYEKELARYEDAIARRDGANKKMAEVVAETAAITAEIGKAVPSAGGNNKTTPAKEVVPVESPETYTELGVAIQYYQKQLEATKPTEVETMAMLNSKIEGYKDLQAEIKAQLDAQNRPEHLGTLEAIDQELQYQQSIRRSANAEAIGGINAEIARLGELKEALNKVGVEAAAAKAVPTWIDSASTLSDIGQNLQVLQENLQNASLAEAALINKDIDLWQKKADAIREAGREAEVMGMKSGEAIRTGWNGVQGLGNGVQGITDALEGNGNAWQKVSAIVNGALSIYDGINTVLTLINMMTAASQAHTVAKGAEAVIEGAAAGATVAGAATSSTAAATEAAAYKVASMAAQELAAAKIMAAHAYIPFAGVGIGAGFVGTMKATVAAAKIPAFANGALAYGPTLGLFGEYAGAANNPEVVAPLDKLQSMLDFGGGGGGEVRVRIQGDDLVGVLNRRNRKVGRS